MSSGAALFNRRPPHFSTGVYILHLVSYRARRIVRHPLVFLTVSDVVALLGVSDILAVIS